MKNYWAFLANPKYYNIEKAVKNLEQDTWTIKRSNILKGDQAIIWKAKGNDDYRGIVAFADVISNPKLLTDISNPYWVNHVASNQLEPRVIIRYISHPFLPIWLNSRTEKLLLKLSVARATGGTIFKVDERVWFEILEYLEKLIN